MLKIGLTGGIGSGKTTVSNLFAKLNQPNNSLSIIDTDIIARHIVEVNKPAYKKIIATFGNSVLHEDLTINRAALRKMIFENITAKRQLEAITHPAIQKEVNQIISNLKKKYCIIVIPLLFETKSDYQLDRVLVVDSNENTQIERTIQRDNILADEVKLIIKSQLDRENRLQQADDIIVNNGDLEDLALQVEKLHHLYLKLNLESQNKHK